MNSSSTYQSDQHHAVQVAIAAAAAAMAATMLAGALQLSPSSDPPTVPTSSRAIKHL
jgi:hypothetical protein